MSDKYQKLTIVLDKEYGSEGIKHISDTLRMIKGVADVVPGEPMNPSDYMARSTVMREFIGNLYDILRLQGGFDSKEDRADWEEIKSITERARKRRGF